MKIGVIGLGYVGLPLAVGFAKKGHSVVGIDTDPRKIDAIAERRSYIEDVPDEELRAIGDRLRGPSRYADLASCDAAIIAVPTPLTRNREPDLGPLVSSGNELSRVL